MGKAPSALVWQMFFWSGKCVKSGNVFKRPENRRLSSDFNFEKTVDKVQKNPHEKTIFNVLRVDCVEKTYLVRSFAIFTTSPAPIVINKSPSEQFFLKKFSISSKVAKW